VIVTGRVLESDGEILRLEVSVHDATGLLWFTSEYEEVVDTEVYDQSETGIEAFQYLYNRIANDVAQHREELASKEIESIRQVAELKFAKYFAPDAFEGYLVNSEPRKETSSFLSISSTETEENQILKVARLPANDDSMLIRIRRIRIREEALVDTLDLQYERLSREIGTEYTQWRIARLSEMNAVRDLEEKENEELSKAVALGVLGIAIGVGIGQTGGNLGAGAGGAVAGTAVSVAVKMAHDAQNKAEEDMKIHKVALEELGESLAEDLKLTVIQVEGETVELKGSAEAKFKQWRGILKQIHEREVGKLQLAESTKLQPAGPIPAVSSEGGSKGELP
jgi:outer membrane lipoprotein SlyB